MTADLLATPTRPAEPGLILVPVSASRNAPMATHLAAALGLRGERLADALAAGKPFSLHPGQSAPDGQPRLVLPLAEGLSPAETVNRVRSAGGGRSDAMRWLGLDGTGLTDPDYLAAALEGVLLAGATRETWRSDGDARGCRLVAYPGAIGASDARPLLDRAAALAAARRRAMAMVDAPPNVKTPAWLAEQAREIAALPGVSVRIFDRTALEEMGMGGLLAVSRGSALPPVLIELVYRPDGVDPSRRPVGLVGKGITFDSGGISLKNSDNLHLLKSDMAGAAAVLGAVEAAARLALPVPLVAVVPACENQPDGNAYRPGDIISTFSGLTVEVIDTDAEGRIVLADGLAWLRREHDPAVMIDVATLTGASVLALGHQAGALFATDDNLADGLAAAGGRSGERVWRMPLWDGYGEAMKSALADVKNYGGKAAGAVTAAKFLQRFIGDHPAWAHIDMPGMALETGGDRAATGYGVRLLAEYLSRRA